LKNSNGICTLQKPQQWRGLQRNLTEELDVPLKADLEVGQNWQEMEGVQ